MGIDPAAWFQQHCAVARAGDALYLPNWSVDEWRALFQKGRSVTLRSGDVLVRRGDSECALYLVLEGALEARTGVGRSESLGDLSREEPGAVVGEISLFDGLPRSATVWAVQPSSLLRLDAAELRRFIDDHPRQGNDLLFALARVLAFRVRRSEQRRPGGMG